MQECGVEEFSLALKVFGLRALDNALTDARSMSRQRVSSQTQALNPLEILRIWPKTLEPSNLIVECKLSAEVMIPKAARGHCQPSRHHFRRRPKHPALAASRRHVPHREAQNFHSNESSRKEQIVGTLSIQDSNEASPAACRR